MKLRLLSILALTGIGLAACGSGSGASSSVPAAPPAPNAPGSHQAAKATLSFSFALGNGQIAGTAPLLRHQSSAHRMFIDGNASNGAITMFFDGVEVMDHVSFGTSGTPGPGPSSSSSISLPGGGSFSYTSTISQGTGNQPWVTVNGTFSTYTGNHTIGVVQTNGPCIPDSYGRQSCIAGTDGYVLAEGQNTFTMQPGSNNNLALYLHGVMQSAYICDEDLSGNPVCDGGIGPVQSDGTYHLYAVVADENGTAITNQQVGGSTLPFDNGSYQIAEQDQNGIVTITNAGPFSGPGTDRHGLYGENITIKCNQTGSTTVAAELAGTNTPLGGGVTGYTYAYGTAAGDNYPAAGSILGAVGADQFFGNELNFSCDASGNITIQ